MAGIGGSQNAALNAGIDHAVNPGRSNLGSITLDGDGGLQADADRWNSLTPRSVLDTATGTGTPATTGLDVELGQEATGNQADADLAQQNFGRAMMTRAADISDNAS